jgi:hypothetical protein
VGGSLTEGTIGERGALGDWSNVGTIGALGELDREVATSILLRGDFIAEVDIVIPIVNLGTASVALR